MALWRRAPRSFIVVLRYFQTTASKVTITGRIVVAADGKSRTVSVTATDANGKKVSGTAVYDKQ